MTVWEKRTKKNSKAISELTDYGAIDGFKVLTQAEYDAIVTPDPKIVYLIRG